jgi:hypothetical protein
MLDLSNITLIAVSSIKLNETIHAMLQSIKNIKFNCIKLITHEYPNNLPDQITFKKCNHISNIKEYSRFMIYELHKYVDSDFCITVQHDGYIINPNSWRSEFLNYDYIGAPWPIKNDAFISPFGEHIRVGNGGFSLRSQKLLQTPNNINIPFEVNTSNFYKHMNAGCYNEDGNICVHNRHLFESVGCKFAPLEVAKYFSHETPISEVSNIAPFGFHGHFRKL